MTQKRYTPQMMRTFDRLTEQSCSHKGLLRVTARIKLTSFVKKHGKDVCDEMWEVIKAKDAR